MTAETKLRALCDEIALNAIREAKEKAFKEIEEIANGGHPIKIVSSSETIVGKKAAPRPKPRELSARQKAPVLQHAIRIREKSPSQLGHHLKNLRKTRALTQYELAEKLGMTRGSVSNIEQGIWNPTSKRREEITAKLDRLFPGWANA